MARILVADDAPAVLEVLDDVLALEGHEVLRATSGQEAVRKFEECSPELVVLDIMMPDMDGLVVLDAIRRTDGDVPVILMTGLVGDPPSPGRSRTTGRSPSSRRGRGSIASSRS